MPAWERRRGSDIQMWLARLGALAGNAFHTETDFGSGNWSPLRANVYKRETHSRVQLVNELDSRSHTATTEKRERQ